MQQLQDQVDTYDELMAQLTSCSAGAEQRYKDLRICFKEMGGAVGTYAEKEDELREPLRKFQSILEHEGEKFGGMHEKMGATVVEPLRDYHRYAECFRVRLPLSAIQHRTVHAAWLCRAAPCPESAYGTVASHEGGRSAGPGPGPASYVQSRTCRGSVGDSTVGENVGDGGVGEGHPLQPPQSD